MELLPDADKAERSRLSHVEPCNWFLRKLFHLLRGSVKDESGLAEWTRSWRCLWRVNFAPSGGPIHYVDHAFIPFTLRATAIAFELKYAEKYMTKRLTKAKDSHGDEVRKA